MKIKILNNTIKKIIWLLILSLLTYIFYISYATPYSAKVNDLKNDNAIYNSNNDTEPNSGSKLIRVLDIEKTNLTIDDNTFYFVLHDTGVNMLEVEPNDKIVNELIANRENLEKENHYLIVKVVNYKERKGGRKWGTRRDFFNITPEMLLDFHTELYRSEIINKSNSKGYSTVEVTRYLYSKDYDSDRYSLLYMGIIFLLIVLLTFWRIIVTIKNNVQFKQQLYSDYPELYSDYPELYGDVTELERNADYINKDLQIIIYKDTLFTFYKKYNTVNLLDIRNINVTGNYKNKKLKKQLWILSDNRDDIYIEVYIKNASISEIEDAKKYLLSKYKNIKITKGY